MKIVVQIHNPGTYSCSTSDNAQQEFKKSYCPTLPLELERIKGTRNRYLDTLSSILRPKGAIVFRVLLQ